MRIFVDIMNGKRSIGVVLTEGLLRLLGHLPLAFHHWMAGGLAWFLRSVVHYRSDVVMTNLSRSFPDKSYEEIRQIHKQFYRHLANIFTEMIWFGACRGEKGRKRLRKSHIVEMTNPEELNRLWNSSRQLMILQSHSGNWELIGGILNYSYGEQPEITSDTLAVTYLRAHSALWDRVMADNRTAPVSDLNYPVYVEAGEAIRFALKRKAERYSYSFITDQFPYNENLHHSVRFMHQDTYTMTAAAALAVKLDMSVAYLRFECREDGGYALTFVPLSDHAAGEDPMALTKAYYAHLEEDLEKQPWNYLWTHRRWKKYEKNPD